MTKNFKKITVEKKLKKFLGSKSTIYLSLGLHKGRPSYRRSLRLSKENIQHFKTWNFLIFSTLWVIFLPLGYGSGSGFQKRIRHSASNQQKLVGNGNIYRRVVELNWFQCRSGSSILGHCGSEYSSVSESKDLMTKIAEFLSLGLG